MDPIQISYMHHSHWFFGLFRSWTSCNSRFPRWLTKLTLVSEILWFVIANLFFQQISFKFHACITQIDILSDFEVGLFVTLTHSFQHDWLFFPLEQFQSNFKHATLSSISWANSKFGFLLPMVYKMANEMDAIEWNSFLQGSWPVWQIYPYLQYTILRPSLIQRSCRRQLQCGY